MGFFLYGQYSKGARTTRNTIDLKFSQFSIPLLTMFFLIWMGFANMSREALSSVSFQKNGPRTLHLFYTCPVLLSNASRIYTFSRLGDAKFSKTYRWLHDNEVMNLLSDLFSQLVKLQWLYVKMFPYI